MKNHLCSLLGFFVFKKKSPQLNPRSELPEDLCRHFSLAEIKVATYNFNPELILGTGAYGTVYKGTIDDGTIVAVKRGQSRSLPGIGVRELRNEVQMLCQLRHPNLVSLIGLCEERNELILVYEYLSRGSLAHHLYGKGYAPLPWKQRLQICISAARGLHYLHTGAKYALYHGNIKSLNILLTEESSCKLLDFGVSELGSFSMSKVSKVRKKSTLIGPPSMLEALKRMDTRVTGTFGYLAPEYAIQGELTEKSDVYSFGVVLFEVLCGRKEFDWTLSGDKKYLVDWAKESLREGNIYDAIDPYLEGRIASECLNKYLQIACSCVRFKGNERPAMGEVEVTLEHALELQDRADSEMEATNPSGECLCIFGLKIIDSYLKKETTAECFKMLMEIAYRRKQDFWFFSEFTSHETAVLPMIVRKLLLGTQAEKR